MTNLVTNLSVLPVSGLNTPQYGFQIAFDFARHFGLPALFLLGAFLVGSYVFVKRMLRVKHTVALTPEDLKMIIRESQQPTIEGIQRIYESMKSHLRTDEVVVFLTLMESLLVYQIIDLCKALQSVTFSNDEEFRGVLVERMTFLVRSMDREMQRIANVQTGMADTTRKIESVTSRATDFMTIIRSNQRYESLKSSCEILVRGIASEHWYL